jgi:PIN domain nuclease of toxin-antitoxin system
MGFQLNDLNHKTTCAYHNLSAKYHKDPFDRMLIWQAINNNYILVTVYETIKKYTFEGLKVIF